MVMLVYNLSGIVLDDCIKIQEHLNRLFNLQQLGTTWRLDPESKHLLCPISGNVNAFVAGGVISEFTDIWIEDKSPAYLQDEVRRPNVFTDGPHVELAHALYKRLQKESEVNHGG